MFDRATEAHAEAWHEVGKPDDYSLETDFQRAGAANTAAALIIQAALEKRDARIVTWLRAEGDKLEHDASQRQSWSAEWLSLHTQTESAREFADAIERGEHKEPKQ